MSTQKETINLTTSKTCTLVKFSIDLKLNDKKFKLNPGNCKAHREKLAKTFNESKTNGLHLCNFNPVKMIPISDMSTSFVHAEYNLPTDTKQATQSDKIYFAKFVNSFSKNI
jgi:hypothetical protein